MQIENLSHTRLSPLKNQTPSKEVEKDKILTVVDDDDIDVIPLQEVDPLSGIEEQPTSVRKNIFFYKIITDITVKLI